VIAGRPEAVSAGTARLVGTDPDRVYAEVDLLLTSAQAYQAMANAVNPYGDGRAAARTAGAIEHMFELGPRPAPFGLGSLLPQRDIQPSAQQTLCRSNTRLGG
jgi:UDP-N-acetylglucosamine 2-epimerase (non-hydrolysing)